MSNRISFLFLQFLGPIRGYRVHLKELGLHTLYFILLWNTATCTHHRRKPHHHIFFHSVSP